MRRNLILALIGLQGTLAMADVLPPPEMLRTYTVETSSAISQVLYQAAQFQASRTIQLPKEGPWGPCTAEVKSLEQPGGIGSATLTCQSRTSCFYKSGPSCRLSFVDYQDRSAQDMLRIVSVTPVGADGNQR